MNRKTFDTRWFCLLALAAIVLAGCKQEPTRWDEAQKETEKNAPAVAKEAVAGSELNKFFPAAKEQWDLTFKQEKQGFAQASLKFEGKEVASLSISDVLSTPDTAAKYKEATEALGGYPMVASGSKGSSILVDKRFQVQVRSMDDSFTIEQRHEWLKKFDLDGLSALK